MYIIILIEQNKKFHLYGYISEFIGLDLTINLENGQTLVLPIECQLQTKEQYKDSKFGFAAHTKLDGKLQKLKNIPGTGESYKYKDQAGQLAEYRDFLKYIMYAAPQFSITRLVGDEFEQPRTMTTTYDLYEAFNITAHYPKESAAYNRFEKFQKDFYRERKKIIPTGDSLLPKYIEYDEIPNRTTTPRKYNLFFEELKKSVQDTLELAYGEENTSAEEDISSLLEDIDTDLDGPSEH